MKPRSNGVKLYGIFGSPLGHTLSPAMQEAAFASLGLKAYYLALELDWVHFRRLMRNLPDLMLEGFNVTVPYKQEIIRYLDRVTPEARSIGAVNTVFRKGRKWIGTNTDWQGFSASLLQEAKFQCRGKNVLVLGAGGSARAVVYSLARAKAKTICIANRHENRARKIVRQMKRLFRKTDFATVPLKRKNLADAFKESDLVINTTSVGLHAADPALIPGSWIPKARRKKKMLFFDLIYRPAQTRFLKTASARGHQTINGLGMLLFQGARAFEYWAQRKAPVHVMKQALHHEMEKN